jgi:peroxiredoxin
MKCPWMTAIPPVLAIAVLMSGCRSSSEQSESAAKSAASAPAKTAAAQSTAKSEAAPPAAKAPAASAPVAMPSGAKAALGEVAPDFVLKDLDGKEHKLSSYRGKIVVLEWFSPGCPYCQYGYGDGPLKDMPENYMSKGMVWLTINSSAPGRDDSAPQENREFVEKHKMEAPLLFDPTGAVGRSFGAKSTPHLFVIDEKGVLVYKGALDNAPAGKVDGGGAMVNYVDAAIADMKSGKPIQKAETKSYG